MFDKDLGMEFLDLTPEEAWSFFESLYERTRPQERLEPSFEPHSYENHIDPFPYAPASLDSHDPSLESREGVEPDYLDIACPNPNPLSGDQFEEPQDYWPTKSNDAQVESLCKQIQHREEITLKADSSAHETYTNIDSKLDDTLLEPTTCPYVRPLTQAEIAESRAFLLLAREDPNSKILNFEQNDYSDNGWDSEGNEPFDSAPLDSYMHETSSVESLEDMPTNTATELEAHPTLTTQVTLESSNTHSESFNAISSGEHTVEPVISVSSCSITPLIETTSDISFSIGDNTYNDLLVTPFEWEYDPNYGWVPTLVPQNSHESEFSLSSFESSIDMFESESGAHLFSCALTPFENPFEGTEHVLTKIDNTCREVVEVKKVVSIDFLGVEGILESTQSYSMFTYTNNFGPYLGFKDAHKAIHSPIFFTLRTHSLSVPLGLEQHIIQSIDPFLLSHSSKGESDMHLSPLDLAPPKSITSGIVSDYTVIDHHWGEVVDIGSDYVDFLGVEKLIKPTISTLALPLWPNFRFYELYLVFHPSMCLTPEECPPLVLWGLEENILFHKPLMDSWDREGVG